MGARSGDHAGAAWAAIVHPHSRQLISPPPSGCCFADGKREFTVPLASFGGVASIVTIKMVAINANGKESVAGSTAAVTVGPVAKPTNLVATPASNGGAVTLSWQHSDASVTG